MRFQASKVSIFFTALALFSSLVAGPANAGDWFNFSNPFATAKKVDPLAKFVCYEGQFPQYPDTDSYDPTIRYSGDDSVFMKGQTNMIMAEVVKFDGKDTCYDYLTVRVGSEIRHVQRMGSISIQMCRTISHRVSGGYDERVHFLSSKVVGNESEAAMYIRAYPVSAAKRGMHVATLDNRIKGKAQYSCGNFVSVKGVFYHTDLVQMFP